MLTILKKHAFLCSLALLVGSLGYLAKNKKSISIKGDDGIPHLSILKTTIHEEIGGQSQISRQTPADSTIIHIVKKGETLYSISNEYGVSIKNVKRWNGLTSNSIQVGEKLKIHPQKAAQTASSSRPTASSTKGRYTVKPGDTLFHIAQMYQMTVEQLKALNDLRSNTIRVGQTLAVAAVSSSNENNASLTYGKFISYTVKKTVPRDSLLSKFGMGKREFLALNPGVSNMTLNKDDQITVLVPARKDRKNPYLPDETVNGVGKMVNVTKYPPDTWGTTTNGELYNAKALTAGSSTLQIGTVIFIKNKQNGRGVFVRINDRTSKPGLKLSKTAWNMLQLTGSSNKVIVFRTNE